jgi:osmoprotectant transport system permease protein
VVLDDPRRAILSYDAIVLLAPSRANDALLARAFEPLLDAIPIEAMREASLRVDRDTNKEPPAAAARWLEERVR